jgi:hypothetical protein
MSMNSAVDSPLLLCTSPEGETQHVVRSEHMIGHDLIFSLVFYPQLPPGHHRLSFRGLDLKLETYSPIPETPLGHLVARVESVPGLRHENVEELRRRCDSYVTHIAKHQVARTLLHEKIENLEALLRASRPFIVGLSSSPQYVQNRDRFEELLSWIDASLSGKLYEEGNSDEEEE